MAALEDVACSIENPDRAGVRVEDRGEHATDMELPRGVPGHGGDRFAHDAPTPVLLSVPVPDLHRTTKDVRLRIDADTSNRFALHDHREAHEGIPARSVVHPRPSIGFRVRKGGPISDDVVRPVGC